MHVCEKLSFDCVYCIRSTAPFPNARVCVWWCISSWRRSGTLARCRVWRNSTCPAIPCASFQITGPKSWPSLETVQQRYIIILLIADFLPNSVTCLFFLHCLSLRHQVFLDCQVTTEKELDTVEVLKAIQKAKEVKDRKSGGGGGGGGGSKKVHSAPLSRETETSYTMRWLKTW